MRGILRRSLYVAAAAVGIAQGYKYEARGLSDILGALEAAGKEHNGQPQVTKEITKTRTVIKGTAASLGTGAALGTGNVKTVTVTAAGLNMTQTVTAAGLNMTQTVTERVTQMVTQVITQMATQVMTSNVTVTMMQSSTLTVPVASTNASLTDAAIQGGTQPTSVSSPAAAQSMPNTLASKASSTELTLGSGVAPSATPTVQAGTQSPSTSTSISVPAVPMESGGAAVAQSISQVNINTFSLSSSLMLGNLAIATPTLK